MISPSSGAAAGVLIGSLAERGGKIRGWEYGSGLWGITFGIEEESLRNSSTGDLSEIGNISMVPFSLSGCPYANLFR